MKLGISLGHVVIGVLLSTGLAACGGDDGEPEGAAGSSGSNGAGGNNTSNDSQTGCQGEAVPALPNGFQTILEYGDLRIVHDGDRDVQVVPFSSSEAELLFETAEPIYEGALALDDNDIFVVSPTGIERFDRGSEQLSLFSAEPAAGEGLPAEPSFNGGIAISDTHVFATVVNENGFDFDTLLYDQASIVVYDRASAEVERVIALPEPVERTIQLRAHGERFFQVRAIDINPEPNTYEYTGEVQTYAVDSGDGALLLESDDAFEADHYHFVDNFLYASITGEDSRPIVRVPIAGGEPEVIYADANEPEFGIIGDTIYAVESVRGADQIARDQLMQVDLNGGEGTPFGGVGCRAVPVHASESYLYAIDPMSDELLRFEP